MSAPTVAVTTPACMLCGKESDLRVDATRYTAWVNGELIQLAFPDMTDSEREQLKSGIHPECWEQMFGDLEDEEDDDAS